MRMLDNADTFLNLERPTLVRYRPDDATLAAVEAPVRLLVSDQSAPFYVEIAEWLAGRLGVEVSHTPGTHTLQHDQPNELAQTIRALLRGGIGYSRASTTMAPNSSAR